MSIFNPNIPQPNDDLSDSQGQILQNFNKANSSFGIDHYSFSDLTVNNGKHNQVTTPAFVDNPPTGLAPTTAAAEPKMYAFQDSANVGVINYSRGPSNAVPSPITFLQSTAAPIVMLNNGTTNVLDFTGLTRAMCNIYASDTVNILAKTAVFVVWTGAGFILTNYFSALALRVIATGNILQLQNISGGVLNNVFWTLQMLRLS
jgi:hypothetical protein